MTGRALIIVDDDPSMGEFLADASRDAGFDPILVTTAAACLAALAMARPDGILTDVVMPDMDGIELVMALGRDHSAIPIVLMSGYDPVYLTSAAELGREAGANVVGVLPKPCTVEQLFAALSLFPAEAGAPT